MMGSRLMQHSKMFTTNISCCVIGVSVKQQHDPPIKILLFAILESKTKILHFPQQVFQEEMKIRTEKGITPCTENNPIKKIKQ